MSWLTAITLLIAASAGSPLIHGVRKCCPLGEVFTGFGKCRPINATMDGVDVDSDAWWWIGDSFKRILGVNSEMKIGFGVMPVCDRKTWTLVGEENFRLVAGDGPTVLLKHLVESSETGEDDEAWHSFAADAFCLDGALIKVGRIAHVAVLCPCTGALACVRKCCGYQRQINVTSLKCSRARNDDDDDWYPEFDEDVKGKEDHRYFHLVSTQPACAEDETTTLMTGRLHAQGRLGLVFMRDGGIKANATQEIYEKDKFCGDMSTDGHEVLVHCMRQMTTKEKMLSVTYLVLFAIGSVALLLVVLISLLLPDMRKKVHGRMALAHNTMLLVGYLSMFALYLVVFYGDGMATGSCKALSLVIQFSFLASFFWLNVMCIDIFWVFSGLRPIQGSAMQREKKKFAYYSIYAWGATSVVSIATIATEFGSTDSPLRPAFGEGEQHFFNNDRAKLLFFYGPMAALLVANLGLFVYTAYKIFQAKQATAILDSADSCTNRKNKQRLALYAKLFCLMGATWVFEVISWAAGGDTAYWLVLDAVNLMRAVFVFVIFCCKRTVLDKVRRRLGCAAAREPGASTYSADSRTTSSHMSRTRTMSPLPNRKISQSSAVTSL